MIRRQIDCVQGAADGGATVHAHAERHQGNGPIGMILVQEANHNQCHGRYPERDRVEEFAHRGERQPLALEHNVRHDQIDIAEQPHGQEGQRGEHRIALYIHVEYAVHVRRNLRLQRAQAVRLRAAGDEQGHKWHRTANGTPWYGYAALVEVLVVLQRRFDILALGLADEARLGGIVCGKDEPEYAPDYAQYARDVGDARPAQGPVGDHAADEHGQHSATVGARKAEGAETIALLWRRPHGQMLVHTGKDDALEEALQYAQGAEGLPVAPGDAPRRNQAKHGRANGGHKEHNLRSVATAEEAARAQRQNVAPIKTGQNIRLVPFRPIVFLQRDEVSFAAGTACSWHLRLTGKLGFVDAALVMATIATLTFKRAICMTVRPRNSSSDCKCRTPMRGPLTAWH